MVSCPDIVPALVCTNFPGRYRNVVYSHLKLSVLTQNIECRFQHALLIRMIDEKQCYVKKFDPKN